MKTYKKYEVHEVSSIVKDKVKYYFNGEYLFVEELAMKIYKSEGFKTQWTENAYWWEIMCLLFWDVIFAKVRGAISVYSSRYDHVLSPNDEEYDSCFEKQVIQMNGMPNDFFTDGFYSRRKQIIANRLNELQNSDIVSKLIISYEKNYGRNCRPIENWNKYSKENLIEPLRYLDKSKALEICHRLLKNFNAYRSGLPDLIVYSDDECFFTEVKSKNDRLSESQINWHNFISENLNLKIELFLVNHNEKQIANIQSKKIMGPEIIIKVSFGKSNSKKLEDAIRFISRQAKFVKEGEGTEIIYSSEFSTSDISSLFTILDLTRGWKSQKIEIDDEIVEYYVICRSLKCYYKKIIEKAGSEWCKKSDYPGRENPFGCIKISLHEFESGVWNDFGYVDTEKGEWIFLTKDIIEKLKVDIEEIKFCPLLCSAKVFNSIKTLPNKVNPKTDLDWAYISHDYRIWIWYKDKLISKWGNVNVYNSRIGYILNRAHR